MAEWRVSIEHLLVFAGDEERQHYLSPERTEAERDEIRTELEELYQSVPDPTEAELKQFMGENAWRETQHNPSARELPKAQWKSFRKADARAELEKRKAGQLSEPSSNESEKPAKKGKRVDLFKLAKRLEVAEKENPPTADELAERNKRLQSMAELLGIPTIAPDFSFLVDFLKRDEEERKKIDATAKPPEWPAFDVNAYPPPLVDWSRAENERREADAEANARSIERAIDNALKKAEDRARVQREMEEMGKRHGFTPVEQVSIHVAESHRFETGIGDARLWGILTLLGLAIAFSRRSANSDLAVWVLLILTAILVTLIVNTHRAVRASQFRVFITIASIAFVVPLFGLAGYWLTSPDSTPGVPNTTRPIVHISSPTPSITPSPIASPSLVTASLVPRNDILFKGGVTHRLSDLMTADGYTGTTVMAELYVQTMMNQGSTRVGPQPDLNAKNSFLLQGGGERMDYRSGADLRTIYIRSDKDGKLDITYRPR